MCRTGRRRRRRSCIWPGRRRSLGSDRGHRGTGGVGGVLGIWGIGQWRGARSWRGLRGCGRRLVCGLWWRRAC
eukprot:6861834-Prymnesium_polylepis.1